MGLPDSITFGLSSGSWLLLLLIPLAVGFVWFIYRYTNPPVSTGYRLLFIFLRSTVFFVLLLLLFEPLLRFGFTTQTSPTIQLYADVSESMGINDGINKPAILKDALKRISDAFPDEKLDVFTFDSRVYDYTADSPESLALKGKSTALSPIFSLIKEKKERPAAIVLLTDGIITEGTSPVSLALALDIPVSSVVIGDTTEKKDVWVGEITTNEVVFLGVTTVVRAFVEHKGFANQSVAVTLLEENQAVATQNVVLQGVGSSAVSFSYTPSTAGEKKLTVQVSKLPGEINEANNQKTLFLKVKEEKTTVLLLSGSPSADYTFIKNSIKQDTTLLIEESIMLDKVKFNNTTPIATLAARADMIFLINFPSPNVPDIAIAELVAVLRKSPKPLFFVLANNTDGSKLNRLTEFLPFTVGSAQPGGTLVQPAINPAEAGDPLLNGTAEGAERWSNLAPVYRPNWQILSKPGSKVLAYSAINGVQQNTPLIVTQKVGSQRSVAILGGDIYRWKLSPDKSIEQLFDGFISNTSRWLSVGLDQKQVSIKPVKKIFARGETVSFEAEVKTESMLPLSDAAVMVKVRGPEGQSQDILLNAVGSGVYRGEMTVNRSGDYYFTGSAKQNQKLIGEDAGRFTIADISPETITLTPDRDLLGYLAKQTAGTIVYPDQIEQLIERLKTLQNRVSEETLIEEEFPLGFNPYLLAILIVFLGLEWFLRKRSGMI